MLPSCSKSHIGCKLTSFNLSYYGRQTLLFNIYALERNKLIAILRCHHIKFSMTSLTLSFSTYGALSFETHIKGVVNKKVFDQGQRPFSTYYNLNHFTIPIHLTKQPPNKPKPNHPTK